MPAFDKLRKFDSTRDGVIDASDARFGELLMWRDTNSDGITDTGELQSLTAAGIKSISLRAANDNGRWRKKTAA